MNNEMNNPVDNAVTNMVSDDINTITDNDNHSQLVETEIDKTGKGRPPHLPNADTRN